MKAAGRCDIGHQREKNEDAIFLSTIPVGALSNVFIVADGMGGHKGGGYASQFAIQYFCEHIKGYQENAMDEDVLTILVQGILYANDKLYSTSLREKGLQGMGTTFIVSTISGHTLYIANVGDSRLYIVEEDIQKITVDHSLVEEMVRKGNLSEDEAENYPNKNVITRAVGTEKSVQVDTYIIPLSLNDAVLMCSDGLTNMLPDSQIKEILQYNHTLEEKVRWLVEAANDNGGLDNISVILIDWKAKEVSAL